MWNAPEAMNRMWSVRTMPYLVLTVDALDDRQQVALHALARDVGAAGGLAAGDLVDLVDEDDARLLDAADRLVRDLLHVDQLARPLPASSSSSASGTVHAAASWSSWAGGWRSRSLHVATPISSMPCGVSTSTIGGGLCADLELDLAVVELALAQHAAQLLARARVRIAARRRRRLRCRQRGGPRRGGGSRRSSRRSSAASRARIATFARLLLAHHLDGELDQVADHRLDVAADVADLGELRRLDLDERRLRQLGQPARDLGLADAGRADHDDVLRRDLVAQLGRDVAGGASGCAARSRRRAWRRAGRRCSGRARRRSRAASSRANLPLRLQQDRLLHALLSRRARAGGAGSLQLLDHDLIVGVDADRGGDPHRALGDRRALERRGVAHQRARRGERVVAARADREDRRRRAR